MKQSNLQRNSEMTDRTRLSMQCLAHFIYKLLRKNIHMNQKRNQLEKHIGISFKNKQLLQNVFIHRSYLNEDRSFAIPSNEKLEFLGDSVLSLSTSIYLYHNYTELKEGDYTDIKASIVRTESLAEVGI